jgi:hypothetical protein
MATCDKCGVEKCLGTDFKLDPTRLGYARFCIACTNAGRDNRKYHANQKARLGPDALKIWAERSRIWRRNNKTLVQK